MKKLLYYSLFLLSFEIYAQVGIGVTTPHASAALEVVASSNNKGVLITRLSKTQRDAIASPATGLLIYQTDNTEGFYYYNGSAWTAVGNDGLGNHTATDDLDMNGNDIETSSDLYIQVGDEFEVKADEDIYLYSSSSINIDTEEESGDSINLLSETSILLKTGEDSDGDRYHVNIKAPITNSDADEEVTLEALRNDQDVHIKSYDEIYLTTVNDEGEEDPDNTTYNTHGDIELTSSDDIILTADANITLNTDEDFEVTSSDEIKLEAENEILISSEDENITIDSGNDIELKVTSGDYVEIWEDGDFLYTLPGNRGTVGQFMQRSSDGSSEYFSDWSDYALPTSDGTSGQILQTNGSGSVSWVDPSSITSDRRLKTNIKSLSQGVNTVMQLNPVVYQKRFNFNTEDYNRDEFGFIAQEVQEFLPKLVKEGLDENKTLSLDYNSLIPILTKAIQEQQLLIEALKARVESLEANN